MLSANIPQAGETGMWSFITGSGVIADATMYNSPINTLGEGINELVWTVNNGTCSAKDTVKIVYENVVANAGADQNVCEPTAALAAVTPSLGVGAWSILNGTGVFASPNSNITSVSSISAGVNTYLWTVSTGNCTASDEVVVNHTPITANAGADFAVCKFFASLNAALQIGESGTWVSLGEAIVLENNNPNSIVEGLNYGNNFFVWETTNGQCTSADTVIITSNAINASVEYVVDQNEVSFSGSAMGTSLKYYWTFGDGKSSSLQNPVYTYSKSGLYDVVFNVKDTITNCQDKVELTVEVGDVLCISDFSYEIDGLTVTFSDLSTGTPMVWNWNFGDGNTSGLQSPVYSYAKPGVYQVSLTSYDPVNNCFDEEVKEIKVGTIPCLANFEAFVVSDIRTVSLLNISEGDINAYFWSFGDNQFSNEYETEHVYSKDGLYTICLTVFNTLSGCQSRVCQDIQIGINEIKAEFNYVVDNTNLTIDFLDASVGNVTNWYWVFGDGSFHIGQNFTKTYQKPGLYNVTLRVLDEFSGKSNFVTKQIQIGEISCNLAADFSYYYDQSTGAVNFSNLSFGNSNSWYWQFDDGTTSYNESPSHVFDEAGYYLVSFAVKDTLKGCQDTKYKFILIGSVECLAKFDYSVDANNLDVSFTNLSEGSSDLYYWSFGDGTYSSEASPVHQYEKSGLYPVFLSVTDDAGLCSDYAEAYIQVGTVNCDAQFEYFINQQDGSVEFKSKVLGDVTSFAWMFGDGSASSEANPIHSYANDGYYYVNLVTFNKSLNCASNFSKTILVGSEGIDCEADFYYQANVNTNEVKFTDNSSGSGLSYIWNFGEGEAVSTEASPTHQYVNAGQYYVCLTVTNDNDISNITCKNVIIGDGCEARMAYSIDGLTVNFGDNSIGNATTWNWSFGDENTSKEQNPVHTYEIAGNYLVDFIISNAKGCENRQVEIISVGNISDTAFVANFSYQEDEFTTKPSGYPVDMFGTGKGDAPKAKWKFGEKQKRGYAENETTLRPTYYYPEPGTYEVCLTIEDPVSGRSATACKNIKVGTSSIDHLVWLNGEISVYPNPASDFVKIQYSSLRNAEIDVVLYNMLGQTIQVWAQGLKSAGTHETELNTSDLKPGVYYLELKSQYGNAGTRVFINR